jgi:hypothetical protein
MNLITLLKQTTSTSLDSLYQVTIQPDQVLVNATKPDFEGDYTIVLFAFVKQLGKNPEVVGNELGNAMQKALPSIITKFNIVKGFLNFTISNDYWLEFIQHLSPNELMPAVEHKRKIMVEYSSPNTNKPLHLGHLRNNFLGWSIAEILKLQGHEVVKTCIVNDRGIHICKSMIAWQLFANGATPNLELVKQSTFFTNIFEDFSDLSGTPINVMYSLQDELVCYNTANPYIGSVDNDQVAVPLQTFITTDNSGNGGFNGLNRTTAYTPATVDASQNGLITLMQTAATGLVNSENTNNCSNTRWNTLPLGDDLQTHSNFSNRIYQTVVRKYLLSRTP